MGGSGESGGCLSFSFFRGRNRGKKRQQDSESPSHVTISEPPLDKVSVPLAPSQATEKKSVLVQRAAKAPMSLQLHLLLDPAPTTLSLWQEAHDQVDEKTRIWIGSLARLTDTNDPIPELVALIRCREEEHKEQAPKVKVGDHEILWRDHAEKVVGLVTTIGDIAVVFAPAPASTVWSAVKVLLTTNVAERKDLVAIMGCTEIVLRLVRRGRVYEEVYIREPPRPNDQQDLKERLVHVYKSCLEFLAFVDGELKRRNISRFLDALLEPGQGEEHVATMRAFEQELDFAARACEAKVSEEHRKLLHNLEAPLKRVDDNVMSVLERLGGAERKAAMDYISTIQVGAHHNEKHERRTKGTCEWLTRHPRFLEWEESACSSVLWLQGSMGTGKSFLSSKVIDRYLNPGVRKSHKKHDEGFAFFYCSSSDQSRQTINTILRSYIRQLSKLPGRPEGIHKTSYMLYQNKDQVQHAFGVPACEKVLGDIINSYPRTTIVLDALDECTEDTRRQFIDLFERLIKQSNRLLKVFIASRKEPDIESYLEAFQSARTPIPISTSDNHGDIDKFINDEMAKNSVVWKSFPLTTKELVRKTLVEQSDGMFRWTYLQWEQLKGLKLEQDIETRIKKLPKTLSESYEEIFRGFDTDSFARVMLERAVRWVMCTRKALDSCTLLTAIRVESERIDVVPFSKSSLTPQTLESVCRHLIVQDSELGIWKFPHASALEFFEAKNEPWIRNARGLTIFMIDCLTDCCSISPSQWPPEHIVEQDMINEWLIAGDADPEDALDPRHPLQAYIQRNWFYHARDFSSQQAQLSGVDEALKRFLGGTGPQQSSEAYQVFGSLILSGQWDIYYVVDRSIGPLHDNVFGIVALGLHKALAGWWDKGLDLHSLLNDNQSDLLTIAATFGHVDLCKELIDRGCVIDRQSSQPSALRASIDEENTDVTEMLLENGANPGRVIAGESNLCAATERGVEYVQLLLQAGVDPTIRCNDDSLDDNDEKCLFGCAISRAAYKGDIDTLEALVGMNATVNPEHSGDSYMGRLAAAIDGGHLKAAQFLVGRGADVNVDLEIDLWGSPLAAAVSDDWLNCARFLVEQGANVNAHLRFGDYGSPLAAAVSQGELDCARFLVERGAHANAHLRYGIYGSPLAAAVSEGEMECATFLMDCGADINTYLEFGKYGSVLAAAIDSHSVEMISFLVEEHNADIAQLAVVRPRGLEGGVCFCTAAKRCEVVDLLVQQLHVDAGPLINMGFDEDIIPSSET